MLDLLRSRSGVCHDVARETPATRARRPPRGSHSPGAFFYCNNWDFNVLGKVFEQETGKDLFQEFNERIAKPIGMQDFVPSDGRWACLEGDGSNVGGDSAFLNYTFSLAARDTARFGQPYLREGRWNDRQIVPAEWVKRSTTRYSDFDPPGFSVYGFLWWTMSFGYTALGQGGHVIAIIPAKDLVIVHRVHCAPPREDSVPTRDIFAMVRMVMDAAPTPPAPAR